MKAQKPAEGIQLVHEFKDTKVFDIACTCTNPDDKISMQVEIDEFDEIVVYFHVTAKTRWWVELCSWETYKIDNPVLYYLSNSIKSFINGLNQRLRITKDVWLNGYVEYQTTTILNKQRALNFAETLKQSVEELEKKNVDS